MKNKKTKKRKFDADKFIKRSVRNLIYNNWYKKLHSEEDLSWAFEATFHTLGRYIVDADGSKIFKNYIKEILDCSYPAWEHKIFIRKTKKKKRRMNYEKL